MPGCFACKGRGNCVFTKDNFAEIFSSMVKTDGIILGSPVYSADVSAKMKAFLERGGVVVATNPGFFAIRSELRLQLCAAEAE